MFKNVKEMILEVKNSFYNKEKMKKLPSIRVNVFPNDHFFQSLISFLDKHISCTYVNMYISLIVICYYLMWFVTFLVLSNT